jgi:hypothetical protein
MLMMNNKIDLPEDDFKEIHEKATKLFVSALERYDTFACQCAFPRFHQITGMDSYKIGSSLKCFDTNLFIYLSKQYFDIHDGYLDKENTNDKWTCKKCGSVFEFEWQEFRMGVERQRLKLIELKTELIGKEIEKPTPLYLGLVGYSISSGKEVAFVDFEYFEKYILEK